MLFLYFLYNIVIFVYDIDVFCIVKIIPIDYFQDDFNCKKTAYFVISKNSATM